MKNEEKPVGLKNQKSLIRFLHHSQLHMLLPQHIRNHLVTGPGTAPHLVGQAAFQPRAAPAPPGSDGGGDPAMGLISVAEEISRALEG